MADKEEEKSEFVEDFTPKTAKKKFNKTTFILIGVAVLIIAAGIFGFFVYDDMYYYQTDNAKVDTAIFQLTAKASGKLIKMEVNEGDVVKAGQVLARVDNGPYIMSPIDGTVTDVKMQRGDYASPTDVVLVVAKTTDMYILANVEETNILKIHKGQKATVTLDVYGQSFSGYVDDVNTITSTKLSGNVASFTSSGTYTKVTQLIPVKIKIIDPVDLEDIIGTNATVKIQIK
jgi:multidrug resistance efflux pump